MFCPYRFCGYSHDDVEILALAECRNGLDHLSGDAHIGAIGAPRGVRGEDDAWNRTERIVGSERLVFEHIERRRNVASLESGEQCAGSMISARAVLMNMVPGFRASRFSAVTMPFVESSSGIWMDTTSEPAISSFISLTGVIFRSANTCSGTWEFHADTFMPKAPAMRATV